MELKRGVLVSPSEKVPVIEGAMVTAIRTLAGCGVGKKAIAREVGVAVNTVRRYLRPIAAGVQVRPSARRLTDERRQEARALVCRVRPVPAYRRPDQNGRDWAARRVARPLRAMCQQFEQRPADCSARTRGDEPDARWLAATRRHTRGAFRSRLRPHERSQFATSLCATPRPASSSAIPAWTSSSCQLSASTKAAIASAARNDFERRARFASASRRFFVSVSMRTESVVVICGNLYQFVCIPSTCAHGHDVLDVPLPARDEPPRVAARPRNRSTTQRRGSDDGSMTSTAGRSGPRPFGTTGRP